MSDDFNDWLKKWGKLASEPNDPFVSRMQTYYSNNELRDQELKYLYNNRELVEFDLDPNAFEKRVYEVWEAHYKRLGVEVNEKVIEMDIHIWENSGKLFDIDE